MGLMSQQMFDDAGTPVTIPEIELRGTLTERLQLLDASIGRLRRLQRSMVGNAVASDQRIHEFHGRFPLAPAERWFVTGTIIGALFVLLFVLARALA